MAEERENVNLRPFLLYHVIDGKQLTYAGYAGDRQGQVPDETFVGIEDEETPMQGWSTKLITSPISILVLRCLVKEIMFKLGSQGEYLVSCQNLKRRKSERKTINDYLEK